MNLPPPFLKRGPNKRGMMLAMLLALSTLVLHFTLRYDGSFMLRCGLYLILGAVIDVLYTLLRDARLRSPTASTGVTVLLLVLSLPAHMLAWQVSSGILVAVLLGKRMMDPLSLRLNPMLLGRLFLMIAFPDAIQGWLAPGATIDALTSATPLGLQAAEGVAYSPLNCWLGELSGDWEGIYAILPGSPGDVLPPLSLLCGGLLWFYGVLDLRAGLTFLLGFVLAAFALNLPLDIHLSAGALAFTAVFIVSDPRSMPASKGGRLIAGLLAGLFNAGIRHHGYLPEGIVPAVLAVNLLSPTLDRAAFQMRGWIIRRKAKSVRKNLS